MGVVSSRAPCPHGGGVPCTDDEEMEGDGVIDPGMEYIPPPAGSASAGGRRKVRGLEQIKQEVESEEEKPDRMELDSEDTESNTSVPTRAREKRKPPPDKDTKPTGPKYTPVSIYEEKLLLRRLEACPTAVAMTPEARRLKRKLIVRQAKRDRGLPLFDLDQVVNAALLLVDGIYGAKEGGVSRLPAGPATYRTTCQDFRILDRYQVSPACSAVAAEVRGTRSQGGRPVCLGHQAVIFHRHHELSCSSSVHLRL